MNGEASGGEEGGNDRGLLSSDALVRAGVGGSISKSERAERAGL